MFTTRGTLARRLVREIMQLEVVIAYECKPVASAWLSPSDKIIPSGLQLANGCKTECHTINFLLLE